MIPHRNPRKSLLAAACLALVAPMAGCNLSVLATRMKTIAVTKPFSAASAGPLTSSLSLDVPVGNVTVAVDPAASEGVSLAGTLGAEDDSTLAAVQVEVLRTGGDVVVKATGPKGKSWDANLSLKVPPGVRLAVNSGVGNVTISGADAQVQARVGVGDIKASALSVKAASTFETGTGGVALDLGGWEKGQAIDVTTGVGDIRVVVPADAGMTMTAEAGVGKVSDSGVLWGEKSGQGSGPSGQARATTMAPAEGRTLKLTTGVGNVTVKAADPARNP